MAFCMSAYFCPLHCKLHKFDLINKQKNKQTCTHIHIHAHIHMHTYTRIHVLHFTYTLWKHLEATSQLNSHLNLHNVHYNVHNKKKQRT